MLRYASEGAYVYFVGIPVCDMHMFPGKPGSAGNKGLY